MPENHIGIIYYKSYVNNVTKEFIKIVKDGEKMNIEVTDKDFDLKEKEFENPKIRYAARGIIYNNEGKIALLYKKIKTNIN